MKTVENVEMLAPRIIHANMDHAVCISWLELFSSLNVVRDKGIVMLEGEGRRYIVFDGRQYNTYTSIQ